MPSSSWDQCTLDNDILEQIDKINDFYGNQNTNFDLLGSEETDEIGNSDGGSSPRNPARINSLQSALHNTESVCRTSMETLDGILLTLTGVGDAYAEVTGRTNNLMMNCERLLEQQHTLQQTVEILKSTIKPFTDIEEVACLLGIPFDGTRTVKTQSTVLTMYGGNGDIQHSTNLDPRSPEFQDILARLAKSALFLQTHFDILDKQHYSVWLERLQLRATSLVGRAMRDLIDKARNDCVDIYSKKLYSKGGNSNNLAITNGSAGNKLQLTNGVDDTPIESAPLYQKFRGLSFRLRELGALLVRGGYFANIDGSTPHPTSQGNGSQTRRSGSQTSRNSSTPHSSRRASPGSNDVVRPVVDEVRQGYVIVRSELLNTFMKDAWAAVLQANGAAFKHSGSNNNLSSASVDDSVSALSPKTPGSSSPTPNNNSGTTASGASLCMGIRQAFSTLLRVTQLEQQLFDSLFLVDGSDLRVHSASGDDFEASTPMTLSTPRHNVDTDSSEVMTIVEAVSNSTRDVLRPLIIRESSVDELCRVVSTLGEDVRSQMLAMPVPKLLLRQLLKGLDGTVQDAKERLSYCAETRIRQDVQMFEPVPAQLAYPEILETYAKAVAAASAAMASTPGSALSVLTDGDQDVSHVAAAAAADVYTTWYPPMRYTLSLLSKLYGVVEMRVFEDFARRGVDLCVATLKTGSERVKRSKNPIHGDLFLVRHLLILREQLVPFEIRLQGTEKHLDFSSTGAAFTRFVANTQSVWRWDSANGLLLFAKSGIPGMQETQMDAKKDLDLVLRQACFSLKQSALKLLLGPLDGFLAKVTAFAGEIPTEAPSGSGATGADGSFLAAGGSHVALLSTEARANLKNQSFVKPERIKEMLEIAQGELGQRVPELRAIMKLYIENQVARTILIRPILQEFGVCQRKLESVVASCLDPGQTRRDLETLLQTIAYTVVAELSQ